jgi:hypothetical protein
VDAGTDLKGLNMITGYGRNQNRVTQTWLVCSACNQRLNDSDFKASARSGFEAYQQALRPFMSGRQMAFPQIR